MYTLRTENDGFFLYICKENGTEFDLTSESAVGVVIDEINGLLDALIDAKQLLDALRMDSGIGEILTDSQRELYQAVDAKVTTTIAKAKGHAE